MNTSDLIFSLRLDINDVPGNVNSDYMLVNSINSVLRSIWDSLSNDTITTTTISLTPTNGNVALPNDYSSVVLVNGLNGELLPETLANDVTEDTYKIIGNTLYVSGVVTFTYKANAPILSVVDTAITPTTIELPNNLFDVIKKYTLVLLQNPQQAYDATFEALIQSDVSKRTKMRNKTKLVRKPIFIV